MKKKNKLRNCGGGIDPNTIGLRNGPKMNGIGLILTNMYKKMDNKNKINPDECD